MGMYFRLQFNSVAYFVCFVIAFLFTGKTNLFAQEKWVIDKHEAAVGIGGGVGFLFGSVPQNFDRKVKAEFGVDFRYDYYLNRYWTLGIGTKIGKNNIAYDAKGIAQNGYIDDSKLNIFKYKGESYVEEWEFTNVSIPISIQYIIPGKVDVSIRTGFAYSFAANSKVDIQWRNVSTSLEMQEYFIELNDPSFMGLGDFSRLQKSKNVKLANRLSWTIEVGIKREFAFRQSLYLGLYADVGLNNQASKFKEKGAMLIEYTDNEDEPLHLNSLVEALGKKVNYNTASFGLKAMYSFKW
ncbi:outer membrane beta-barrel protein [Myroides sp. BIT-d1]|uniref:Outer membrane beta-barrel protein n=2 Tax=Myroides albus TaxID=2562892 RepID=A0A6I3LP22_9FLAO|nr:outer membrane beta-barrel protein [Myroides albus]